MGYDAKRAGPHLDAAKIDVLATKEDETVFVQAKLGAAGATTIRKLMESVASQMVDGRKLAVVIASTFPPNAEFVRRELELKHGFSLLCIHLSQLLSAVPEYRRSLDGADPADGHS